MFRDISVYSWYWIIKSISTISLLIVLVCDSGYYGVECLQECSSFCKLSKNCHHVSGHCKDGCKKGWQGMDCFEGI